MQLDIIGLKHGTDKASTIHDYLAFYESRLEYLRYSEFVLLELGVFDGSSVKMWKEYFPLAKIVGVDYVETSSSYAEDRVVIEIGDASDVSFLKNIIDTHGVPTVIIDDASHRWDHQIIGLQTLFPLLNPGGHYIIEDIDTSFEGHLAEADFKGSSQISAIDYTYKLTRSVVGDNRLGAEGHYDLFIERNYKSVNSIEYYRRTCLINKRNSPREF